MMRYQQPLRCQMQCSSCRAESASLTEYSVVATVSNFRKTIETIHLCAVCRIIYLIKPAHIARRMAQSAMDKPFARRRVA